MNTNKQGRPSLYAESLKIAVATEYLTGNLGYGALAAKYKLAGSIVRNMVDWYKRHYPDADRRTIIKDQAMPALTQPANNRDLEKQLEEANLKIAGLQMLIAIAQKELGVDIIKKPGTKQS